MLEGADKFNNLIGSVVYEDGDKLVDLSLELVKHVSGAARKRGRGWLDKGCV